MDLSINHLIHLAQQALDNYDLPNAQLTFIHHNVGATFRLDLPAGQPLLMKLHVMVNGAIGSSPEDIESRMAWLAGMGNALDLTIQTPVRNRQYAWVTPVLDEVNQIQVSCTVQAWIAGEPPHGDFTMAQLGRLGRRMAQYHEFSRQWGRGYQSVPAYNLERLAEDVGRLHEAVDLGVISEAEFSRIVQLYQSILSMLGQLETGPDQWGPVHGDINHDNVLVFQDDVRVIDFDGLMTAPYIYDIGVTLYHVHYQGPEARQALVNGYQTVRLLPRLSGAWMDLCAAWAAIDNLAFQITLPQQRTYSNFRRNIQQLAEEADRLV